VTTQWGQRAAELYGRDYARRYRTADDEIRDGALVARFSHWLRALCESFGRPIAVLDLGCGTGRYFHALANVRELVGIDVSAPMLDEARRPVDAGHITVAHVTTIHDDFLTHDFAPGQFDLVYSIGVLAEHSPFDEAIARRVSDWLAPGGLFAFTAVHPSSFSVPRTTKRRLGEALLPLTAGPLRRALRERLMADGLYADEQRLREVLESTGFAIESIEPFESDVHRHLLATARKGR
jgi:SAM-dependent methyltransferase